MKEIRSSVMAKWAPPPKLTVSQWADRHRKLSSESSAIPGQWKTALVEYMREPMDCIGDPRVIRVVVMAGAQVAKTEVLMNAVGYLIDYDPSPIMVVQPTLDMAAAFSKDRIAPMLRDTPRLRDKITERARDSGSTIFQKTFPGGHMTMVGANSPSSLASRPIRGVFCDEVDRFPPSAGSEGDPISLAVKRTVTFWNRIVVFVSTPTDKGASRIEAAYEEGDQRQRWCPCPDCGEYQILAWSNVKWTKDKPETAEYACKHCGSLWSDAQRVAAVRRGEWRASAEFRGIASFHVPGLLSPFASMADGVREFLEAQGDPARLKVWVNTYLGETWEETGQRLDPHALMDRIEEYETRVPEGVTLLTAGVDVQDDRIEIEIVGWGDDAESWSIDYRVLYGDPTGNDIWEELTAVLKQVFRHPIFGEMSVRATCVDTGYHTARVYKYVRATPRAYGVKGIAGQGKPLVGNPTRNNFGKIPLFPVGVHTAKDLVYARLKAKQDEVGYCHFPHDREESYFEGLTAEKLVTRYHKGFKRTEYIKVRKRNEPLDLRVYATAALEMLGVDLVAQRRAFEAQKRRKEAEDDKIEKQKTAVKTKTRQRPRASYMDGWRTYE